MLFSRKLNLKRLKNYTFLLEYALNFLRKRLKCLWLDSFSYEMILEIIVTLFVEKWEKKKF